MGSRVRVIALMLVLMAGTTFAQQNQQQIQQQQTFTVPASMLTEQQKAQLTTQSTQEALKGWAGVGHEVGTAVNESLKAITSNAADFAKTDVGRLTVAIVIWKVIGDQAVHVGFGILFALFWISAWVWSFRNRCIQRTVLIGIAPDKTKTYKLLNERSSSEGEAAAHFCVALAMIAINLLIIFSY